MAKYWVLIQAQGYMEGCVEIRSPSSRFQGYSMSEAPPVGLAFIPLSLAWKSRELALSDTAKARSRPSLLRCQPCCSVTLELVGHSGEDPILWGS